MKAPSRVFVLAALVNLAACNSTTIHAEANGGSNSGSDLKYRVDNGIGSFHGLGGVNYDLVKNVLSQLRTGASDVLVAVPTQVGRIDLFNNNAVVPRYQFGRPPPPPHLVPFPPGAPYKGGGYRGVKSLPLAPVGGGEIDECNCFKATGQELSLSVRTFLFNSLDNPLLHFPSLPYVQELLSYLISESNINGCDRERCQPEDAMNPKF